MSSILVHIDHAKREILAADSLVKVKDLWNKAEAVRQLGQAARDPELITYATEFKLRTERRLGEILIEMKTRGEISRGQPPKNSVGVDRILIPTIDIDHRLSARAQKLAMVPEAAFEAAVAQAKDGEKELTRKAVERLLWISEDQPKVSLPFPEGKYRCIVIDPPWPVEKIEREVRPKQGKRLDYPVMGLDEIEELPVPELADPEGCHIYLWTTQKCLLEAGKIFESWGANYQCLLTWVKPTGFTPYSWMYNTEHVLFGRIGSLTLLKLGVKLSFEAPSERHSRKPDIFYDIVRQVSPGPRLDMFARERKDGFDAWGNEVR